MVIGYGGKMGVRNRRTDEVGPDAELGIDDIGGEPLPSRIDGRGVVRGIEHVDGMLMHGWIDGCIEVEMDISVVCG